MNTSTRRNVTARKADHVGMAGNTLLCDHCGARQELTLPQSVDSVVALMAAWTKTHTKCAKREGVSAFREASSIDGWMQSDDTGTSSKAIYAHMRFGEARKPAFPWDPSDFGRCYRLLKLAPSWRARIGEMATYGPAWTNLSAAWDELTALYEEEAPRKSAPRLYARMKELIGDDLGVW